MCDDRVPRGGPAVRDVDWALGVAGLAGGRGSFWASALAAHTAREALLARRNSPAVGDAEALAFVEGVATRHLASGTAEPWAVGMGRPGGLRLAGGPPGQPPPPAAPAKPGGPPSPEGEAKRVYQRKRRRAWDPDSPPGPGETVPGQRCEVKCWALPLYWNAEDFGGSQYGFWFAGLVEFKNKPEEGLYCECCVFRQFLRTAHTKQGVNLRPDDFGEDNGGPGTAYGHDRPDPGHEPFGKRTGGYGWPTPRRGEPPTKLEQLLKDNPQKVGPFGWQDAERKIACGFVWEDSPRATVKLAETADAHSDLWMDFLGVVYDRCNQWKLVEERRMQLWLRVGRPEASTSDEDRDFTPRIQHSACSSGEPGSSTSEGWTDAADSTPESMHGAVVPSEDVQKCK